MSKSSSPGWGNINNWMLGLFSNGAVIVVRGAYSDGAAGASYTGADAKAVFNDGGWHHIAMVVDLNNEVDHKFTLWLDGAKTNGGGAVDISGRGAQTNALDMTIGAMPDGTLPFPGQIEQARISEVARTSFPAVHGLPGTYSKGGIATQPHTVAYNGAGVSEHSGVTTAIGANEWDWAANTLYLNLGGVDPAIGTVEVGQRDFAITNSGSASYITVDGLEASGANIANVLSSQNNGWTVQNSNVWGAGNFGILLRGNPGGAGSATGLVVQNNTVGFISKDRLTGLGYAINVGGATAPVVAGNTVNSTHGVGIQVSSGDFAGGGAVGTDALVYSNVVTSNEANILLAFSSGGSAYRNRVYDSKGFGISTHSATNSNIYYNVISNLIASSDSTLWNGIDANTNSTGCHVYNNTIVGVCGNSVTIEGGATGCIVRNNVMDARLNTLAPVVLWASPIYVDGTVAKAQITLSNNDLVPRTGGIVGNWQTVEKNMADWITASGEANSINAEPLFVSASDFHLQSGSPAINAGVSVGLTQDFAGKHVPIGSAPDIGAYEFDSGMIPVVGRQPMNLINCCSGTFITVGPPQ
jgi:hypothetical protein